MCASGPGHVALYDSPVFWNKSSILQLGFQELYADGVGVACGNKYNFVLVGG